VQDVAPKQVLPQLPQLRFVVMLVQEPLQSMLPAGHVQVPPTQLAPEGQAFPHAPQLVLLVFVSTQDVPHCVSDPQPDEHTPALQTCPVAHMCPQVPQLLASEEVGTHAPLHTVVPAGQVHWPPLHDAPIGHALPQSPQFFASDMVSTQAPPQLNKPPEQTQRPLEQVVPAPHTVVHVPQCSALVWLSTHEVPHAMSPPGHKQTPLLQVVPEGHAWPHLPQFAASLLRSTQVDPPQVEQPPLESGSASGEPLPASGALSAAIQPRMHSFCASSRCPPIGMAAPHAGVPITFVYRSDWSALPGTTRIAPSHVPAPTPTSSAATLLLDRSRAAARSVPLWQLACVQLVKIVL
jgi:hypothetical protein